MKLLVCALPLLAGGDDTASVVERVAEAQARLPWFWSPPLEGLAHIPFTYEMKQVKRAGKSAETRTHMERIPQARGAYYRCLAQNEASPCTEELVN